MEKTMSKEILKIQEKVIKIRNSKNKYVRIPEEQFKEISHGDIAETIMKEKTEDSIFVIYQFNQKNLKKNKR
jgi:hypothetical protein